ncbi:APC family permease [Acidianus sp. HS-5]|uniref:APC family permease n=1 Tax=Acidianus sp. HS-5 TaxID=2886040 RepID=UPI001F2C26CF|nr:APC family permease [Acidianus sp. HS-5]BDC17211.1 amino acid permease [Acidianus sp. HS-5]
MAKAKDFGAESDQKLSKSLNKMELFYIGLGGIIGSGWLFATLYATEDAGGASILSWIIGGILIAFIALAYAEISSAIPKSGGIARYPHYTHGGLVGFIMTWAYLISTSISAAAEATASVTYLSSLIPSLACKGVLTPLGIGIDYVFLVAFFFINYFGVKFLGRVSHGVGWWKLLIPSATIVILLVLYFHPSNFTVDFMPSSSYTCHGYGGFSAVLFAIPNAGILFSYLGFRQPIDYSGEAKNPKKNLPFAVIGSLSVGIVIYVLLQVVFIGGLNWSALGVSTGDWKALASTPLPNGPFFCLFRESKVFGLVFLIFYAWSIILLLDAVVSPSGTGWIYMGTASRTIYAFSANGYLPEVFLRIGKTRVPIFSLILTLIIGSIFLLPFPAWVTLTSILSSASVFTYMMGGIGMATLRRLAPDLCRPYVAPAGKILAPLATLSAGLLVYWSGFTILFYVVTAIFIGLPLFFSYYAHKILEVKKSVTLTLGIADLILIPLASYYYLIQSSYLTVNNTVAFAVYLISMVAIVFSNVTVVYLHSSEEGKEEIKAGIWLISFIFTMLVLSYLGGFGPADLIPFPEDTIVIGIVTLIFHFIAVKSGIKTKALGELKSSVSTSQ